MNEGIPGGKSEEDCFTIAKALEKKGILALHLRHGVYETTNLRITTNMDPVKIAVDYASNIKAQVSIPILVDGALMDPDTCEQILAEKKADMTGLGRPLLADPEWLSKARAGKAEDIRPCLRCNECIDRVRSGIYCGCSVNPLLGREQDAHTKTAGTRKKVLVVGGGQSGMLTALYASQHGHDVTLVEKRTKLGGHMLEGSVAPFKKETARYLNWIMEQIARTDVTVKTGITADREFVKAFAPDAVVICSGSVPSSPNVPGLDGKNVKYATDALLDDSGIGDNVVIVGAGPVGCETAIDLAMKGKMVTLVDMTPEIGIEIILMAKKTILETINKLGIDCKTNRKLCEITKDGIKVVDEAGNTRSINADTVVMATGLRSEDSLYRDLLEEVQNIYKVGDCIRPRKFINATREAYAIASLL